MEGGLQKKVFLGYTWWFIVVNEERARHFNVSPGIWFHVGCIPFLHLEDKTPNRLVRNIMRGVKSCQRGIIAWDKA